MVSRRILIVEDEDVLRRILTDALTCAGYEVVAAADGEQGLLLFDAHCPDLVVADIMLPRMDGFDMVRRMRSRREATQYLFLSARSDAEDVVDGFKAGASDYIRKPFAMNELLVRIEALLSRIADADDRMVFDIGEYSYDSSAQILVRGAKSVRLSSREASILSALVRSHGKVVSSRSLLLDIWGDDSYYNLRSLNVYVSKLRSMFHADSSVEIISERGIGYKLCVDKSRKNAKR